MSKGGHYQVAIERNSELFHCWREQEHLILANYKLGTTNGYWSSKLFRVTAACTGRSLGCPAHQPNGHHGWIPPSLSVPVIQYNLIFAF